jgi:hypothetical protein
MFTGFVINLEDVHRSRLDAMTQPYENHGFGHADITHNDTTLADNLIVLKTICWMSLAALGRAGEATLA